MSFKFNPLTGELEQISSASRSLSGGGVELLPFDSASIYGSVYRIGQVGNALDVGLAAKGTLYLYANVKEDGSGTFNPFLELREEIFDATTNAAFNVYTNNGVMVYGDEPGGLAFLSIGGLRLNPTRVPASSASSGSVGEFAWDADYIYVCVGTNTWKRVAISTW